MLLLSSDLMGIWITSHDTKQHALTSLAKGHIFERERANKLNKHKRCTKKEEQTNADRNEQDEQTDRLGLHVFGFHLATES